MYLQAFILSPYYRAAAGITPRGFDAGPSQCATLVRLRPSSTSTCSRAAHALSGRSTTSVTPTLEVTVNFMAVCASSSRFKTKTPAPEVLDAELSSPLVP
jgi:hypothetical protein